VVPLIVYECTDAVIASNQQVRTAEPISFFLLSYLEIIEIRLCVLLVGTFF
jgi:hypothetical protein